MSIAFFNSSSFINGEVTTRIIALVTGIAIAAFDVVIFDLCKAIDNSSPILSALSSTVVSSGKFTGWIKNLSRIHWLALLLEICANLISLLLISTPTISSPWTAFFPSLAFKKLSIFCLKLLFPEAEIFCAVSFLPKLGFVNFKFLNFSRKLEGDFVWVDVSVFSDSEDKFWFTTADSIVFPAVAVVCSGIIGCSGVGVVCSGITDGCLLFVSEVSWEGCSSFPLFAWISSNHFSNIGIASSRLGVPDEEIFCFPSI